MTTTPAKLKLLTTSIVASIMLTACASTQAPDGAHDVRGKLDRLQSNQELASRAPVSIQEAEAAVRLAETPESNKDLVRHRLVIADQKIDIASAQAQTRLYEDQRAELIRESESARLDSRTREVDRANFDASLARDDASTARQESLALQRQLDELKAQETERGLVITLGDVLFATGRSELSGSSSAHLSRLATFLNQYPGRTVLIEGHTDNVGSADSNFSLSQNRALSVQAFLLNHGVAGNRLRTQAMGEGSPVASNASATGRQQNRRVEVIIENNTPITQ